MAKKEETYQRGEHISIEIEVTDPLTGDYIDPVSLLCSIKDSSNVVRVDGEAMTQVATGKYIYSWQIPTTATLGKYTFKAVCTIAKVTIERGYFYVEESF